MLRLPHFRISENNFQVFFNDLITFASVSGRFVLKYANIFKSSIRAPSHTTSNKSIKYKIYNSLCVFY